ncbi:hypothetical protein [Afipia clevelandensis]|uniref:hypothetical protein n=1 Tax=Afipia clevelandensis TaxID=1034 RepID=UPI001AEC600A|nr:hypothetical protein [Afipia clevelandensis]
MNNAQATAKRKPFAHEQRRTRKQSERLSPVVNPERARRHPQKRQRGLSRSDHNAEKQATNFSESAPIGIEAGLWPFAEHAS